ncbi:MAG: ABC transporter permease [Bacteroidales bacterium]|nr:ABC transporter permease [Bacteroidales bacterium]
MKGTDRYLGRWFHDVLDIFNRELKQILHDGGVMIIFIVAGFLYPILYNFVYKNGLLEDTPIAVVEQASCSDTRRLIREMDATREISIAYRCVDMEEAKALFQQRKVNGIIFFPADFGDKLAHDETAVFSIYADMSSFLYYKNLLMGSEFVMLHEINAIKIERYAASGLTDAEADAAVRTVRYEDVNPYNRAFSYSIFLISAILMLIIQQVMFYGMSMSVGTMREENRSFASLPDSLAGHGVGRVVLGRGAVYWLIFMLIGIYVACIMPAIFRFPQRGLYGDILVLLVIFVTDCVFFSMAWSTLVTRRESAFILFLFMSPVCVFLTGFSWPDTAFPGVWKVFSYLFPSTFGCKAFINLNTAGADLEIVSPLLRALVVQTGIYFVLACLAIYVENFVLKRKNTIEEKRAAVRERVESRISDRIGGNFDAGI